MAEHTLQKTEQIDSFERDMDRLRVLYIQYFQGQQKVEPLVLRKRLFRQVVRANVASVNNTSARFRLRSLLQRWNTYVALWNRMGRAMEDGTALKDRRNARDRADRTSRRAGRPTEAPRPTTHSVDATGGPADLNAAMADAAAAVDRTAAISDNRMEEIYRDLVVARQRADLPVEGMTYDAIRSSIQAAVPGILKTTGVRRVDFRVVEDGANTRIEAVPVTEPDKP